MLNAKPNRKVSKTAEITTLGLRLDVDTATRLLRLCEKTGHTKSYYAKKALRDFLEEQEDYLLAIEALKDKGKRIPIEDVMKRYGLES